MLCREQFKSPLEVLDQIARCFFGLFAIGRSLRVLHMLLGSFRQMVWGKLVNFLVDLKAMNPDVLPVFCDSMIV